MRGPDGLLRTIRQEAGSDQWTDWSSLGPGGAVGKPAVARDKAGRLVVFVRARDAALWTIREEGERFGPWVSLGADVSDPVAIANVDGRLEVLARGRDGALWDIRQPKYNPNRWTGWEQLGGAVIGTPTAAVGWDGRVAAFVRGPEGALWTIAQDSPGCCW